MDNRPLSPHLQIYKPQLTSILSITHRGTGVFLTLGAFFLSCWLMALADGPKYFSRLQDHLQSWYGQIFLYGLIFSFYFHLFNGIRHLFWDAGLGLDIKVTYRSGYAVVIASIVMTLLSFMLAGKEII